MNSNIVYLIIPQAYSRVEDFYYLLYYPNYT